jgi:protein-tyrosine phosphatase
LKRMIPMSDYPLKWITEHLAVGYAPRSEEDLESVKVQGITAIVNLCAECYDLHTIEEQRGFLVYFLPLPDEGAPDMEDMEKAVAWVDESIASGNKILVHCRFGIGRTGTLVVAYLLSKGYSLKEALRKMEHTPSVPNSREQWELLERYGKKVGVSMKIDPSYKDQEGEGGTFFRKWAAMLKWFTEQDRSLL